MGDHLVEFDVVFLLVELEIPVVVNVVGIGSRYCKEEN